MAEKVHKEKLKGVQTRLTYGESSHQNSQTREEIQLSESESCDRKRRSKNKRKQSLNTASRDTRLSRSVSVFSRLRREGAKQTRRRSPVSTIMLTRVGHRDRNVKGGFQPERLAQARICRIFLDGDGILVVRIISL
ncbi:hypothetical protein Tco_0962444 [Tanacetum coccineum]